MRVAGYWSGIPGSGLQPDLLYGRSHGVEGVRRSHDLRLSGRSPAVFAWWLVSNRCDLVKVGSGDSSGWDRLQPMRDLFEPYKPHRYYYEVVGFGRRISLFREPGCVPVPRELGASGPRGVVFAAVFIAISEMLLSPFVNPMDAWLYRSGAWVEFFSMYLDLLLKVDASDENKVEPTSLGEDDDRGEHRPDSCGGGPARGFCETGTCFCARPADC